MNARSCIALFALALGLGSARSARAEDDQARCTVRIIHAVPPEPGAKDGKGEPKIDPKIEALRPYLTKPPLTAWHEFVLLDEKTLELKPKAAQSFNLPTGKPASLTFMQHLPDEGSSRHRLRLQLQIGDPAKPKMSTVFVLHEGSVVLEAGSKYKGGTLILGTSCDHPH